MNNSDPPGTESRDAAPTAPGKVLRAGLFMSGLVAGVVIGTVTFWMLPLSMVAAVGLAVAAGTVERPRWLPSLLWGGSLGATLPFLMVILSPLLTT